MRRGAEVKVGLIFVIAVILLGFTTWSLLRYGGWAKGYSFDIIFHNAQGLQEGDPVRMSGVTIGRVTSIHFDSNSLEAVVTFVIDSQYDEIPDDSDASILTAGLLGSQYIGLTAGGSPLYLENGSEILFTQSAVILENIIGKFLIGGSGGDDDDDGE